jgi:hypothetical protein
MAWREREPHGVSDPKQQKGRPPWGGRPSPAITEPGQKVVLKVNESQLWLFCEAGPLVTDGLT